MSDPESPSLFQYSTDTIASQFNHVLVVVAPAGPDENGNSSYYVQCAWKEGVDPFGPNIPKPPCRVKGHQLREFLMCKLINAECAAYVAPSFKRKLIRTRDAILTSLSAHL